MPTEYASSISLGDHVKDPISGFEGTVTSKTQFLHGCQRCGVTAHTLDKDGKDQHLHFDEAQLVVIEAGKHAPVRQANAPRPPGGPERDALTSSPRDTHAIGWVPVDNYRRTED